MMSSTTEQQDIDSDLDENAQVDNWSKEKILAQVKEWVSLGRYPAVSEAIPTTLEPSH